MSSSSEGFLSTSGDRLHKPKLKSTSRTKMLTSVPEAKPEAGGGSASGKQVEKRSGGKKTSGHRTPASTEIPSKQFSREKLTPQEITRAAPKKHITLPDGQSDITKSSRRSIQKVIPHIPRTYRNKRKTIPRANSGVKEAAKSAEGSLRSAKSTSLLESVPAFRLLDDAKASAPPLTGDIPPGKEHSSSDDAFEIEHPLLRVPTSEDLERAEINPEKDRDPAHFTRHGSGRPSSRISLDDPHDRSQKRTRRRSLAGKHEKRKTLSPGAKHSSTSFSAPQLAESGERVPLVSREQCKQAAISTQARPAVALTLDDMAESHKNRTWLPGRRPSTATRTSVARGDVRPKRSAAYEEARAPLLPGAIPGDYEVLGDRMSSEEYVLYPLAVFLLVGFALVVIFIFIPRNNVARRANPHKHGLTGTCESPSCFRDAVYLNSLLSWDKLDPCDDFYAFVCRQWEGSYATPSPGSFVSVDDDFAAFLEGEFYAYLQQDSSGKNSHLQPIIDLHRKCMDKTRIEDAEWDPLLELMSRVSLDGFPLTPPVRKTLSVWRTAAKILRLTGSAALLGVGICSKHSTVHTDIVLIGLPDMITNNDNIDINEAVRLYTRSAFAAMNSLKKQYMPPSFTLSIIKFATDLEKLADVTSTENASSVDSLRSLPQLAIFLEEIFKDVNSTLYSGETTEAMLQPAPAVSEIIQLADDTDIATVINYLGVRLMTQVSPFVPQSGLDEFYSALLYGKRRGNLPRWQLCLRAAEKALLPLTNLAVLTDLNAHVSISGLRNLAKDIIAEFKNDIDASPYFTPASKDIIRSVLNTTRLLVAGPDWLNDSVAIDAYVRALSVSTVSDSSALDTYVIYHEHDFLTSLARGSAQRWSRSTFSTDCWYEPYPDTIYVPLLVFNVSRAKDEGADALQLSRAGPRLMRCAFDALISKTRASTGVNDQWLEGETKAKLREVEACLDSPEASLLDRFKRTRDVLAANFSFENFIEAARTSRHPLALMLPPNRLVTEQRLFFIYLMLQSCEKSGGAENRAPIASSDWNIVLRNTEQFPVEFSCSSETPMNVQKKCLNV
ncbi:hypothetical protein HPB52_010697 [Rhipicephalus sanguineus]|uniref:Peptidase M13 N-terminal domain-containing protein n=2 Tax=Rhipicephalus sanguineus TaxID=34632 RepID=A0A9D4PZ93_RHISA|nr:hypothetical protein HPB52_010697 [Rhipicephalus sanguineus]